MFGSTMIESPCVKVCTLDARSRLCLGCGRTIDEIAQWASMSEQQRRRVMAELPARRQVTPRASVTSAAG